MRFIDRQWTFLALPQSKRRLIHFEILFCDDVALHARFHHPERKHDVAVQIHAFAPITFPFLFAGEELQEQFRYLLETFAFPVVGEPLDSAGEFPHRAFDERRSARAGDAEREPRKVDRPVGWSADPLSIETPIRPARLSPDKRAWGLIIRQLLRSLLQPPPTSCISAMS